METDLTTQLTIEEKADLENLEGAIKRELGSFIVVGMALEEIRVKGLYREGYKTFKDYCNEKWNMSKTHANRLINGFQIASNLSPVGDTMPSCEIQPTSEYQVRPLVILEPNEQRDVWEEAVRTAPVGKVCHFRTPAISVSGGFSDETAETASGLCRGSRWPGAVAASWRIGPGPADPWPRGKVTPAPFPWGDRLRAVVEPWWPLGAIDLSFRGKVWGCISGSRCSRRAALARRRATAPCGDFLMPTAFSAITTRSSPLALA